MSKMTSNIAKTTLPKHLDYSRQQGIVKNITENKKYLKPSPQLQRLMNLMPYCVSLTDYRKQQYAWMYGSTLNITGYSSQEMMDEELSFWQSFIHPDDLITLDSCFARIFALLHQLNDEENKNYKFSYNYRVKRKDGTYIKVLQNSTYLEMDKNYNPLLALTTLTDITAFKNDNRITLSVSYSNEKGVTQITSERPDTTVSISNREIEIIQRIAKGTTNIKIAEQLFVSENTIKTHRKNILDKTGCKNAPDLIRYAIANGII